MRPHILCAALAACAFLALPAQAQAERFEAYFFSGNDLYELMTDETDRSTMAVYRRAQASAYVTGISDATNNLDFCLPKTITRGQIYDVVKRHLQTTPQTRHFGAGLHVAYALKSAYPCAGQGGKL